MGIIRSIYVFANMGISLICNKFILNSYKKRKSTLDKTQYEILINNKAGEWAKNQLKHTGAIVDVKGLENIPECPVVFISNHQSNVDIALFLSEIKKPKGFVAKVEMMKIPIVRDWMKELNCVFMDRKDIKQSLKCIIEAINIVKNGYSMVIFPEGTRSQSHKMNEFKPGSFKLATKSKAPIVPVTIDGSYKLFEENGGIIKPAKITMTIHKAIETDKLSKDEESNLADTVKGIIGQAL